MDFKKRETDPQLYGEKKEQGPLIFHMQRMEHHCQQRKLKKLKSQLFGEIPAATFFLGC
jgi:hypothetical protein